MIKTSGSFLYLKFGCGTWIRTKITSFKGSCPTIRRSRNGENILAQNNPLFQRQVLSDQLVLVPSQDDEENIEDSEADQEQ